MSSWWREGPPTTIAEELILGAMVVAVAILFWCA